MTRKNAAYRIIAVLIACALLVQPVPAFARDHRGGSHHYPSYGKVSWWLPAAFATLIIAGMTYYYSKGVYYRRSGHHYVVVEPPVGATVAIVPAGYQPIIVGGVTYYTNGGIYYQYTPSGYILVPPPPAAVSVPAPAPVDPARVYSGEAFTVNIPDKKGGYTPVVIKRSGAGFVGPQGEYYASFPAVDQLKVMYGNK